MTKLFTVEVILLLQLYHGAGKTDWSIQVPDTVNVESGKSARLPCTFTHPIDDYRGNITVIWRTGNTFHGPVIFQCVLPYQESAETYTCNNVATTSDKDRYLFSGNPNNNDISIEIVNIRNNDRNEYFCRVQLEDVSHAYSSEKPINLQVNGIGRYDWSIQAPATVNAQLGMSTRLPCTFTHPVDDYKGNVTVIWRTGDPFRGPLIFQCVLPYQENAESYTCTNAVSNKRTRFRFGGNLKKNDISIEIVSTSYSDRNSYFCRVQLEDPSYAYSSGKAIRLQVDGAGKTDWSIQVPDTVNVESGKSARLPCTFTHPIDDYRGNITVIWKTGNAFHGPVIFQCVLPYQESAETYTCNNVATKTDKDRYLFSGNPNDNDISIEIVNIRDSDRNEYFCRVQLEDPSHAYSSQNPINLQVNGVGKADWSIHVPDTVNTESGKSAKLPCTFTHPIDDYRGDITVIWRTGNAFNGPVIFQCVLPYQKSAETYTCDNVATSTDKHHYRFSGNPNNNDISIEIINTKYGDINKYFCRVQLEDATHAYSSAKAISLQVHGPPRILSLSTKIYEDKEVAVICTVEAEPAPTITWKISSSCQPMLQSLRHNPTQHLMIGEIQNITSSANYTCISINEHGRDEKVFQYLLASSAGIPVLEKSEALKRELKPLNEAVIVLTLLCIALLILLFILGYKYRVKGKATNSTPREPNIFFAYRKLDGSETEVE